jgi:hypothetical protein
MKRVITTLLLVLALVPLILLSRWGGEAKAPWSVPKDGVRARLVASRFIWRPDEAIDLHLRVENRSSETRVIGERIAGTLALRHEKAEIARFDEVAWRGPGAFTLAPGEVADLSLGLAPRAEPGLYAIDGSLGYFSLLPLKLRVVKRRAT